MAIRLVLSDRVTYHNMWIRLEAIGSERVEDKGDGCKHAAATYVSEDKRDEHKQQSAKCTFPMNCVIL